MKAQTNFIFTKEKLKKKPKEPVNFRLEHELFEELVRRGEQQGIGHHEMARIYVREILSEKEERVALRAAVNSMNRTLVHLRHEFAVAVEALLASAGKVDEAKAKEWVVKHFNRQQSPEKPE